MKINEIIQKKYKFNNSEDTLSQLEKELLIANVLRLERSYILTHPEHEVSSTEVEKIERDIQRRQNHEPIAYILGYKEFFGLKFKVTSSTLIPRPETEALVEKTLEYIKNSKKDRLKILEVGTGSGCIPISIIHDLIKTNFQKNINITAIDISEDALQVARENAEKLILNSQFSISNTQHTQTDISHLIPDTSLVFSQADILSQDIQNKLNRVGFDLIISNPPYIKSSQISSLMSDVKDFEPRLALDGGVDGDIFYKAIRNIKADRYIFEDMNGDLMVY